MDYKGYKLSQTGNILIVKNIENFIPKHIFECGQCFRWIRQKDESYTGVVKGKVINVNLYDNSLIIKNSNIHDFINIWYDYFDLGTDYSLIISELKKDTIMREALHSGYGIRILKQDFWETLISFIISANNKIPRIMKIVESLSKLLGEQISSFGEVFYTFPSVDKFQNLNIEHIECCKAGFRSKYIINTSRYIKSNFINSEFIKKLSTHEARQELIKLPGVGEKVADCTLLFSGLKQDVFPTDVWVKRVMQELYLKKESTFKDIQLFAKNYFGELSGIAQQYLFYYARENKIGVK